MKPEADSLKTKLYKNIKFRALQSRLIKARVHKKISNKIPSSLVPLLLRTAMAMPELYFLKNRP